MNAVFSGAILAGGRSSRMGRDKAFLPVDGSTLIERQASLLREMGCVELIVSGRPGVDYALPDAYVVHDQLSGAGPIEGVAQILRAARCELVLILAVDLPRMSEPTIHALLSACTESTGAVFQSQRAFEPLAAVYPKALLSLIESEIARNRLSLQPVLARAVLKKQMQALTLTGSHCDSFLNWNDASDLSPNQPPPG